MIDTIRLRVSRPVILPDSPLVLVPPALRNGIIYNDRILQIQREGNPQLEIFREGYFHQDFVNIHSFANYLMVTVHLPQYFRQDVTSVQPLTLDETRQAFERLQLWLHDVAKIDVNTLETGVSRLDLFANARSRFSMLEYQPLFELLDLRRRNPQRYSGTFYLISTGQTTCIYDKGARTAPVEHAANDLAPNLIRWEIRLKRARTIHRSLRIHTLGELLDNWERVTAFYRSEVRRTLRMQDNLERNPECPDLRSEIGQLARQPGDAGALSDWLMVNGARHIAERYPHIGDVKAVLRSLGYEPYQISRFVTLLSRYRSVPMMGDLVTINDLRAELYRGLVG